jgi:endoglucanase
MDRRALLKNGGLAASFALLPAEVVGWVAATGRREAKAEAVPSALGAAIHLNQLGYLPGGRKVGTVANLSGVDEFAVHTLAGNEVFRGKLGAAKADGASGDVTRAADFSEVMTPGTYRVKCGDLLSDAMVIGDGVYGRALYLTARAYYGQRCGCAVDLGDGYKHPACHLDGAYHWSSGKAGKLKRVGGWHDAGDYGRYVANSGITTATLLYAAEMWPEVVGELRLDNGKRRGKMPDLLAEVKWNLDWMFGLQDADGGVWHKQTSENFCGFIMPEKDTLPSYVIGSGRIPWKTTAATADLAAVAAIAARLMRGFDKRYAAECLARARKAWAWAVEHPDEEFENPPGVSTGDYGDRKVGDELMWASAELFRTTGEPQFEAQFRTEFAPVTGRLWMADPSWANLLAMGCYAYAMSKGADVQVRDVIVEGFKRAADELVKVSAGNGYGHTLAKDKYYWGSNGMVGNQGMLLMLAERLGLTGYKQTALGNLDYLLGRNCLGVSWVTGVGVRPVMKPHHRPSAADGIEAPWPGLLSGGPNRNPGDDVARALPKGLPPMRMWVDDQRAYSLNEVAINWNAPLVFLLVAANSRG